MYILTMEEEDFPYPTKITIEFNDLSEAINYLETEYDMDYEFVSLIKK